MVVMVLCFLQKPFFYPVASDGFTVGVQFVDTLPPQDLFNHPLYLVHALRYAAVAVLWKIHAYSWAPLVNAVFILGLLWPLVSIPIRSKGQASPWRVLLFYLPCLVSMRGVMVTVGIGYLFILFMSRHRSRLMYAVSALCANLSSASVLLWLIVCAGNMRRVRSFQLTGAVVTLLMLGSLSISVMHKYNFFHASNIQGEHSMRVDFLRKTLSGVLGMEDGSAIGQEAWWVQSAFFVAAVMDNSTVVVSLASGDYGRALGYVAVFLLYVYCLRASTHGAEYEKMMFYFLIFCFPLFLMEGLGVIALVSPMLLFLLERDRSQPQSVSYQWRLLDRYWPRIPLRGY